MLRCARLTPTSARTFMLRGIMELDAELLKKVLQSSKQPPTIPQVFYRCRARSSPLQLPEGWTCEAYIDVITEEGPRFRHVSVSYAWQLDGGCPCSVTFDVSSAQCFNGRKYDTQG